MNKRTAAAAATAIIATTSIIGAVSASASESCPPGQEHVTLGMVDGCAKVTNAPGEERHGQTQEQAKQHEKQTTTHRVEVQHHTAVAKPKHTASSGSSSSAPSHTSSSNASSVTPSVGVIIRDGNGNLTTSGISSRAQFEYLGQKMQGKNGDGTLIKIRQITSGGWGGLYEGWIPVKYTANPSMF